MRQGNRFGLRFIYIYRNEVTVVLFKSSKCYLLTDQALPAILLELNMNDLNMNIHIAYRIMYLVIIHQANDNANSSA